MVAAAALLVEAASELTVGQSLTVVTPHQVHSVLETKSDQWMTRGGCTKCQAKFIDMSEIILKTCQTLNPATLMPGPDHLTSMLGHDCSEIIDFDYSS